MHVAYFSPLPPDATGVADYSAALVPVLARRVKLEVFSDSRLGACDGVPVHPVSEFEPRRDEFSTRLYHLGNSAHYEAIYSLLLRYPGVVVLHDGTLHHLVVDRTLHHGDPAAYVREMAYAHGEEGYAVAQEVMRGAFLDPFYRYPLLARAMDAAIAVIAHSSIIARAARAARPDVPVLRIDHFAFPDSPPQRSRETRLDALGFPADAFVVAALGPAALNKRVETTLAGFALFSRAHANARFLWVGARGREAEEIAGSLNIASRVRWTGRVDEAAFCDYYHLADAAINLRFPTTGEASGAVMRLFAAGIPTLVTDAGWFAELPDETVVKIAANTGEVEMIARALARLAEDATFRERIRVAAREYARQHTVERAAQEYAEALRQLATGTQWNIEGHK